MYYSTENYYIVGDLKEIRKNFLHMHSQEIKELELAIKVIEESKEMEFTVFPVKTLYERLDVICDEYPFLDSDKVLEILRKKNVARFYEIEGIRILETVPKLNFFKHPISNYNVFKAQEDYLKNGGKL